LIAVHSVALPPSKKWSAAVIGSHAVNRSTGELFAEVEHPAVFDVASAKPRPLLEPAMKQFPARYSTKLAVDAPVFCTVTSVRYESAPLTYESACVIVSPVDPACTTVVTTYGSAAVPLPLTPDCVSVVKAVYTSWNAPVPSCPKKSGEYSVEPTPRSVPQSASGIDCGNIANSGTLVSCVWQLRSAPVLMASIGPLLVIDW
jgi:hypothetical protein